MMPELWTASGSCTLRELENAAYKDGGPDPLWGAALSCWWKARRAVQKYSILSGAGSMGG